LLRSHLACGKAKIQHSTPTGYGTSLPLWDFSTLIWPLRLLSSAKIAVLQVVIYGQKFQDDQLSSGRA
jgi:hypothetical protein